MTALAVFLVTAALDAVWTWYVQGLAAKRVWQAATCAASLILLGAFNTVSIVGNPWLALPASAGAFVGTYLAVRGSRGVG